MISSEKLVLWDMSPLLLRIASFLNKVIFPFIQFLSLSIGFLNNKQLNLSLVTFYVQNMYSVLYLTLCAFAFPNVNV